MNSCFSRDASKRNVTTKKQSLTLLGRDHHACTVGGAAGAPEASRSD